MYERFVKLLQQHGISAYKVSKETGIGQSTFTDWKTGRSTPKNDKLQKIADYFGVNISYFNDEPDAIDIKDDYELFNYYYLCNEELLSPIFSKFIRLKRIDFDYTERAVSSAACVDLDRYIRFESGEEDLLSSELYKIMGFMNINIRYICGSLSSFLFALKAIYDHAENKEEEDKWKNIMVSRYDLYNLEKSFSSNHYVEHHNSEGRGC